MEGGKVGRFELVIREPKRILHDDVPCERGKGMCDDQWFLAEAELSNSLGQAINVASNDGLESQDCSL